MANTSNRQSRSFKNQIERYEREPFARKHQNMRVSSNVKNIIQLHSIRRISPCTARPLPRIQLVVSWISPSSTSKLLSITPIFLPYCNILVESHFPNSTAILPNLYFLTICHLLLCYPPPLLLGNKTATMTPVPFNRLNREQVCFSLFLYEQKATHAYRKLNVFF